MRKICPILILSLISLTGCAQSYTVYTNGFAETGSRIPPSANIYIAVEPNAVNPIFENEVKSKIETLLESRGYQIVDTITAADYRLTFRLGFIPRENIYFSPIWPYSTDAYYGYHHQYYDYVPHVEAAWDRWLHIKVHRGDTVVWVGEAEITESYLDERKAVDYLLVGAFEYFGQDTVSRKVLTISSKDTRIAGLSTSAE